MGIDYILAVLRRRLFLKNFSLLSTEGKIPPPAFVVWDATKRCNLNCIHCSSQDRGLSELSLGQIKDILDELASIGVRRFQITGGEPLLRSDLCEILEYAAAKRISTSLATNGFLLDKARAEKLVSAGISSIQVSLHGPASVHNAIAQHRASFTRAVDSLRILRAIHGITVGVATTVMPLNLASLNELKALLLPLKIDYWSISSVLPAGKANDLPDLYLNPSQFRLLLEFIKNSRRHVSVEYAENFPYLGKYDRYVRRGPRMCPAGVLSCCIGVDGHVKGCPDQADSDIYREGDLITQRFSDIWQQGFQRYRQWQALETDIRCKTCTDREKCHGGCVIMREKRIHCYQDYL
jgi:radical SAM protein with 4Fe4S-binding SPASM domain